MFLGNIITETRKQQGMTQFELADGICTQNTISKIEKHNIAPTVKILVQLCLRLKITLNDVFSDFNERGSEVVDLLISVEKALLLNRPVKVNDQIAIIKKATLNLQEQIQFNLITALQKIMTNQYSDSLFDCDKILTLTKNDSYNIYTLLAYTIKGTAYYKLEKIEEATYFYDLVSKATKANSQIANSTALEVCYISDCISRFYTAKGNHKLSMQYINRALQLNKKNGTAYFIGNLLHTAYLNAQALKVSEGKTAQLKAYADTFLSYDQDQSNLIETLID
ncbi:helix-turn-helix domain-containing protein [Agrilactobacillus fermenti]|uniref:helix-turn-helix domain-containing protein n=1 Tax=Agrilactobacillus fermenti TaxID=2586909 RepID=UPI003A5BCA30